MSLDILENIYYDHGILFWNNTVHPKCKQDCPCGTTKQNGYIEIQYKKKRYYAHRLIWLMFNNTNIPDNYDIDHIDGNPSNNHIENLRCIPHNLNLLGTRKLTRNTSGTVGLSWNALVGKWEASITYKGKRLFREYFINKQDAVLKLTTERQKLFLGTI